MKLLIASLLDEPNPTTALETNLKWEQKQLGRPISGTKHFKGAGCSGDHDAE